MSLACLNGCAANATTVSTDRCCKYGKGKPPLLDDNFLKRLCVQLKSIHSQLVKREVYIFVFDRHDDAKSVTSTENENNYA
jgi:hypothetical protein